MLVGTIATSSIVSLEIERDCSLKAVFYPTHTHKVVLEFRMLHTLDQRACVLACLCPAAAGTQEGRFILVFQCSVENRSYDR